MKHLALPLALIVWLLSACDKPAATAAWSLPVDSTAKVMKEFHQQLATAHERRKQQVDSLLKPSVLSRLDETWQRKMKNELKAHLKDDSDRIKRHQDLMQGYQTVVLMAKQGTKDTAGLATQHRRMLESQHKFYRTHARLTANYQKSYDFYREKTRLGRKK